MSLYGKEVMKNIHLDHEKDQISPLIDENAPNVDVGPAATPAPQTVIGSQELLSSQHLDKSVQTDPVPVEPEAPEILPSQKFCGQCGNRLSVTIYPENASSCSQAAHICQNCLLKNIYDEKQRELRSRLSERHANELPAKTTPVVSPQDDASRNNGGLAWRYIESGLYHTRRSCDCQQEHCVCGCCPHDHSLRCTCDSCLSQPKDSALNVNVYFSKRRSNLLDEKYHLTKSMQGLDAEIQYLYSEFPFLRDCQNGVPLPEVSVEVIRNDQAPSESAQCQQHIIINRPPSKHRVAPATSVVSGDSPPGQHSAHSSFVQAWNRKYVDIQ